MKKSLPYLSAFLLAVSATLAQPSLTQAYAFAPGDVPSVYLADTVGVQPGTNGANQTWNFSSLVVGSTVSTNTCVTVASTAYASNYPTSTVGITGGSGAYNFFKVNSTSVTLMGVETGSQSQIYSDPHIFFTFPFTYNSSITDNIGANYTSGGFPVIRTGTSYTSGDGYGTLILPSGTYSNVLKVHMHYIYVDSLAGFPSTGAYNYFNMYYWYDAAHKVPILTIGYIGIATQTINNGAKTVQVADFAVGMEEKSSLLEHFEIFPNPAANTNCSVSFSLKESAKVTYDLMNITGQKIKTIDLGKLNAGEHLKTVETTEMPAGMYFVVINVNGIRSQKRIIIE